MSKESYRVPGLTEEEVANIDSGRHSPAGAEERKSSDVIDEVNDSKEEIEEQESKSTSEEEELDRSITSSSESGEDKSFDNTNSQYTSLMEEILAAKKENESSAAGWSIRSWYESQSEDRQQNILKILYESSEGLFKNVIKKLALSATHHSYEAQQTEDNVGYRENLASVLPQEGETKEIDIMKETEEWDYIPAKITLKNLNDRYYLIEGDEQTVAQIEGNRIIRSIELFEELERAVREYDKLSNIDVAIDNKDFNLINRIIKEGDKELSNEQIIKLMRLSIIDKNEKSPTFLHKLLDPITGISDSNKAIEIITRAKDLITNFEYESLLNLSDGIKPAKELFTTTKLKALIPKDIRARTATDTEIDTHQTSIHGSVDISAVNLYKRFKERYPEVVPNSDIEEKGKIEIARTEDFKGLINEKLESLRSELNEWLDLSDEDLKANLEKAQLNKPIEDLRFELEAAKRLVDDCIDRGIMDWEEFEVNFNEVESNGLNLKEVLTIVYDTLNDDQSLVLTGEENREADRISHFLKLVTHLYETKREYNNGSKDGPDLNKCAGGAMNHFIYSLHGICKDRLVDVAYIQEEDIKEAASRYTNEILQQYLNDAQREEKEELKGSLAKWKIGKKLPDVLNQFDPNLLPRLKAEVEKELTNQYGKYFTTDNYLLPAANAVDNCLISAEFSSMIHDIDFKDIFSAEEFVENMQRETIPLYSLTAIGYQNTLEMLKTRESVYFNEIVQTLINEIEEASEALKENNQENVEKIKNKIDNLIDTFIFYNFIPEEFQDAGFLLKKIVAFGNTGLFLRLIKDNTALLQTSKIFEYLTIAIANDHSAIANLIIEKATRKDLGKQDEYKMTALHWAANTNNSEIAKLLIKEMCKKDLGKQDVDKLTALQWFLNRGNTQLCNLLIREMRRKDLGKQDMKELTALHWAINRDNDEAARLLIEKMRKKDLAIQNEDENTALELAIEKNNNEIAELLIKEMRQEDLIIKDEEGLTLLHLLINKGNNELAKELIKKMQPDDLGIQDNYEMTPLFWAIDRDNAEIALALIEKMHINDLGKEDNNYMTALHWAVNANNSEIALALIEKMHIDDLGKEDNGYKTALSLAFNMNNTEIALALIEKMDAEDLGVQHRAGQTYLHRAIGEGGDEIALMLIDKMEPTSLALGDMYGNTALFWALDYNDIEIASKLIDRMDPKDLAIKNDEGATAITVAVNKDNKEMAIKMIVKLLEPKNEIDQGTMREIWEYGTNYMPATTMHSLRWLEKRIKNKNPSEIISELANEDFETFDPEVISIYLNNKNNNGNTNFAKILKAGNEDLINKALEYGADTNLVHNPSDITSDISASISASDHAELAELGRALITPPTGNDIHPPSGGANRQMGNKTSSSRKI